MGKVAPHETSLGPFSTLRNWSDFGLNRGASLKPDRDITSCKSQGGLESRNEESGQKLTSYNQAKQRQAGSNLALRPYRENRRVLAPSRTLHPLSLVLYVSENMRRSCVIS